MTTSTPSYRPQVVFHPGETLEEKLAEIGMSHKEFALRTSKPEKTIIAIIKGRSSITPDMAVQFEQVLHIPAHFWLNMQRSYDEQQARQERLAQLTYSVTWAEQFPYSEMVKKGWITARKTAEEKALELLRFFSFSDHHAWEEFYFHQNLKVQFRISLAHTKQPYAVSAWLRRGEQLAAQLPTTAYDEKKFKDALPLIKSIMAAHPHDFFEQLQSICSHAGVKVVYTPCISKAPINGCTRWLNDVPLIQLTGRYNRNDIFWFTFFHEAGHIILHGKKDIFLENIEYSDKDLVKEKEADEFAIKWTLSKEEEDEILQPFELSEEDIMAFAKKFNTHPAIIVGRLQYLGLQKYSVGKKFFEAVNLA